MPNIEHRIAYALDGVYIEALGKDLELPFTPHAVLSIAAALPCHVLTHRIAYAFDGVYIEAFGKDFKLPFAPRGGGWTEATYIDSSCRLMRNSLGDTLFFQRSADAEEGA